MRVREVRAHAYTVPTDAPEADGTIEWDSTTIVVATVRAGEAEGIGYTYAALAAAVVIADTLAAIVRDTDLSAHCAPALHRHLGCAVSRFRHLEWFHDHARLETMLFDGAPALRDSLIAPDLDRTGLGLVLKTADADRYASRSP